MHANQQQQLTTPASVDIRPPDRQQAPTRLENMAGIMLAGAQAWGACEFEQIFWRPLLPILSKPLVGHILDWLQQSGVPRAQICANSNTRTLRRTLGTHGPAAIQLEYYEDLMPRGPAGCARDAASTMEADTFVVLEGTVLPSFQLMDLLEAHRGSNAVITVVARRCVQDNGCRDAPLEPVGMYIMDRSALESVPDMGYQDIKEALIPNLYKQGQHIAKYIVPEESIVRVRCSETYLAANMWALQKFLSNGCLPKNYTKLNGACVHEYVEVDRSVRFVGPVLVESGTIIEPDALIVGPTTIGETCTIGRNTVISCSVIWDDCSVGAAAMVDHCIVTDHSCVDPGIVLRDTIYIPPRPSQPTRRRSAISATTSPVSIAANEIQGSAALEQGCRCANIESIEGKSEGRKLEPVRDDGKPSRKAYVEANEQC